MVKDTTVLSPARRRTLLALFAATVVYTVGEGSVQILLAPYLEGQGLTQATIGRIVASYSVVALVFRFITGSLYRPQRTVWLVPGGCVLQAVAFLLTVRTADPLLLTLLFGLNGAGQALASTGGLAAIMDVTDGRNAGSVMGWYTGFIGAGYGMAGFLGGFLGDQLGLAGAISALAGIPLIAGAALAGGLRRVAAAAAPEPTPAQRSGPRLQRLLAGFAAGFRFSSPLVWVATIVALQINLVSGVLYTFFPLYGLSIGLTLTQVGALNGVHSGVSSITRFIAPPVFRRVSHRGVLPWMVLLSGTSVIGTTLSPQLWALTIAWIMIGAARGMLRVASAALVTEAAKGPSRGAASGIYMAGLDVGRIIGPVLGGIGVEAIGYRPTFFTAGLVIPAVYFTLTWMIDRRHRPRQPVAG